MPSVRLESKFKFPRDLTLLLSKLRGEGVVDRFFNASVQMIDINLRQALAQPLALFLKTSDHRIVFALDLRKSRHLL